MRFQFNGVSERDMDLLFLEEFAVNRDFLNLFIQQIKDVNLSDFEVVSGELSFVDRTLGESDLTIILEHDEHKVALLIEDKINAITQPRQYERYVERGNKGVQEKAYDAFYVFLIAPSEYIKDNDSALKYPLRVKYEDCRELFSSCVDAHSEMKYQQLNEAIGQGRKPYIKIVDETSTCFWDRYVSHMYSRYPEISLKSKVREKSRNGDWPTYKTSLDMKSVYIHHKMKMKNVDYSYIDLTFNGLAEYREQLKELLQEMLGEQYDSRFGIHKAGKSAVLRLKASKYLDWQVPFEEQIDIVNEHLDLVVRLCDAAKQINKAKLIEFYSQFAPEKLK